MLSEKRSHDFGESAIFNLVAASGGKGNSFHTSA